MMKIYEEYAFCMQKKEEDMLAQEKMADGEKEELSQVCVSSPKFFLLTIILIKGGNRYMKSLKGHK